MPATHPLTGRTARGRFRPTGRWFAGAAAFALAVVAAPASDPGVGAVDLLHGEDFGVWIALEGTQEKPECTRDTALDTPIHFFLRDVTKLPSLAAAGTVNGTLSLRLGNETFVTWGALNIRYDEAGHTITLEGDRLMSPVVPDASGNATPDLDGRLALEFRTSTNHWLVLRRATWTRTGGEVTDLQRLVPSKYQSPVGPRFAFFSLQ